MNARISSIENTIAFDPGGRNIFGLARTDQLRLAAQSLRLARRVGIVSGFYIPAAGAGETDGPPGAKVLGDALAALGIDVDYITDARNAPLFEALGAPVLIEPPDYVATRRPTHLVSVERVGRALDGRYHNMRGEDITGSVAPLDELFLEAGRRGLTTIGIGDGGNEIGMGNVFADTLAQVDNGPAIACVVPTDFCIAAGVSNWGAYGLAGALSVLEGRDLLPTAEQAAAAIERMVHVGGAVDGVTHQRTVSVDGLDVSQSLRMLESIRRQIAPTLLDGDSLAVGRRRVGILGFGHTGRAAAELLLRHGHEVLVSDSGPVAIEGTIQLAGVETGGHSVEFLEGCDLVVASPGVDPDAPVRHGLHRRGIPVISALELAYQLCDRGIIAVTGTIGKRTTVETLQTIFGRCGRELSIGGNRGRPLAEMLLDPLLSDPLALAVSSFQLETVVQFRPRIAVFLNIDEAHLDRHRSIAEYIRIKSRIFMNQRPPDVLILNYDDPRIRGLARKHHGRTLFFSTRQEVDRGAWIGEGVLQVNLQGAIERIGAWSGPFPENVLASCAVGRLCGLPPADIAAALGHPSPPRNPSPARERGSSRVTDGQTSPTEANAAGDDGARLPEETPAAGPVSKMPTPGAPTLVARDLRIAHPREVRALCRTGVFSGPTAGVCDGFVQVNLVILPQRWAADFERFCRLNPRPCPLLEVLAPGCPHPPRLAPDADVRTDLPRYRVLRGGVCTERPTDLRHVWGDDLVTFLIGCSFTFEAALIEAGLPVRHVEERCNVPMYRTSIPCVPSGPFAGPMVVSMRPMSPEQARRATQITAPCTSVHGAPVHTGDPETIGIIHLDRPDYGDAVTIRPGEVPVFWACGVTPLEAIHRAAPELAIVHEPGHMLVTDVRDHDLWNPTGRGDERAAETKPRV
jgi:uncharacterized protein YcsI (UPF0317 family)